MQVSIIEPCYHAEAAPPFFLNAIQHPRAEWQCGFMLLSAGDSSHNGTLLRWFVKNHPDVRDLSFPRNFSKECDHEA